MPTQALTPESLMARADSKNPATTCKGITTNGRPCRRALGASARNSPASSPGRGRVVIALSTDTAEFYCWQHKDQANQAAETAGDDVHVVDIQKRSSVDSLAARLGLLNVEEPHKKHWSRHSQSHRPDPKRQSLSNSQAQLATGMNNIPAPKPAQPRPASQRKRRERSHINISMFCCMRAADAEDSEPATQARPIYSSRPSQTPQGRSNVPRPTTNLHRPTTPPHNPISYLSRAAPPATIALLSTELAKPLTQSDREPGYIYIFWVVPKTSKSPATSDATALLAPPRSSRPMAKREVSDLLRQYSVRAPPRERGGSERRTIMLKIGRTINVQRRMYDWKRQCGEDIMLLRSYPFQSSSSASSSPAPSPGSSPAAQRRASAPSSPNTGTPRKVPLMPRVERLIHLELQEQRVMRQCSGCGKQHREWFEVESTMDGVRAVDETIRRWVEWAERTVASGAL